MKLNLFAKIYEVIFLLGIFLFSNGAFANEDCSLIIKQKSTGVILTACDNSITCTLCSSYEIDGLKKHLNAYGAAKAFDETPASIRVNGANPNSSLTINNNYANSKSENYVLPGQYNLVIKQNDVTAIASVNISKSQNLLIDIKDFSFKHSFNLLKIVGISSIGFGIATSISGVTLIGFDDTCSTNTLGDDGRCTTRHSTKTAAIPILTSGALIATTGIALLIIRKIKKSRNRAKFLGSK